MINHPAFIFIIGSLLIPLLRGKIKQIYILSLPILAFFVILQLPEGIPWTHKFMGYEISMRVDKLSLCFSYIFVIMAFLASLFAINVREDGQHVAAFIYAGSSLGVVFAGDLISLFIFWELMSISSIFLILYRKTKQAIAASFRYLLLHTFGGSCLLLGICIYLTQHPATFGQIGPNGIASVLILIGFLLNAAAPPLHAWLPDAYPESTPSGGVFLSTYTTKTAVYTLIRAFPGVEILLWVGILMAIYGILFAILENDMRRILAYSIINQVGFMIAGIGIGTPLALNGSTAHAFCHILYKGLLWMSAGSVLFITGLSKCTELGGLYKSMPLTLCFCLIGAASISAFPLFSGFISKSMIISAAAEEHLTLAWLLLQMASAGVFLHAGIKFPYFVFFAKEKGVKARDPPLNMLIAMGLTAFLCVFFGVFPGVLYNILPYNVEYVPYTPDHVISTLQLLLFSALAFFILLPYLQRKDTITLDVDWFYRKAAPYFLWFCEKPLQDFATFLDRESRRIGRAFLWFSSNPLNAIRIMKSMLHLMLVDTDNEIEVKIKLEKYKLKHLKEHEYIGISVGILAIIIILVLYLLTIIL